MAGRRNDGFTLIELIITMAITVFVLAMASNVLTALIGQFKQQSKIAETSIESVVGLELLRRDIQSAGYGLPWSLSAAYNEASVGNALSYNDAPSPPRALVSSAVAFPGAVAGSDYLVIKSINVARNRASERFALLHDSTSTPGVWDPAEENLDSANTVVVLSTVSTSTLSLVTDSTNASKFHTTFGNLANFAPGDRQTYIVYGLDEGTITPRMPFNRADYFVSTVDVPSRCAPGTGVLTKYVINLVTGGYGEAMPLLDCVADMQVVYAFDMDEDGTAGTESTEDGSNISTAETGVAAADVQAVLADPDEIRDKLKEVRVYVVGHEGQRDPSYTYSGPDPIVVGPSASLGRSFSPAGIADGTDYRWKLYSLVEKPRALR